MQVRLDRALALGYELGREKQSHFCHCCIVFVYVFAPFHASGRGGRPVSEG